MPVVPAFTLDFLAVNFFVRQKVFVAYGGQHVSLPHWVRDCVAYRRRLWHLRSITTFCHFDRPKLLTKRMSFLVGVAEQRRRTYRTNSASF